MLFEFLAGQITTLELIIWILALVIAITVHEFSHALSAYQLGDPTAKALGRLTLNPLKHLDPIGTMLILFTRFGWGKPTPFDPYNLRNPKRDSAFISIAGPISNLIVAALFVLPFHLGGIIGNEELLRFSQAVQPIVFLNLILAVFNLIPIHPLDGFKVLAGLLPRDWYHDWMRMERYGIFILLALLFFPLSGTPIISSILSPALDFLIKIYYLQF